VTNVSDSEAVGEVLDFIKRVNHSDTCPLCQSGLAVRSGLAIL
jgi:hypothetical protein